jgi:hypothetical protein
MNDNNIEGVVSVRELMAGVVMELWEKLWTRDE